MSKIYRNTFITGALVMIGVGFATAFIDLDKYGIHIKNDGYVGAIFSLSGVFLYFTALMYQIKEYKLQVEELKKSVEAQTKSSEALDAQKNILVEQNTYTLIFGMISSLNDFKERNEVQEVIDELLKFYQRALALRWQSILTELQQDKEELNKKFATDIKEIFTETIFKHEEFTLFKNYIQFIYNILHLIDISKENMSRDNFTSFFFSQLNPNETILIYLSNLVGFGMPYYDNLQWGYDTTKDITDLIKKYEGQKVDFNKLDDSILMKEFQKLKQN